MSKLQPCYAKDRFDSNYIYYNIIREYLREIVGDVLDCDIVVSKFEFQSLYNVYFRNNSLRERYELSYLPNYESNSTTAVRQQGWLWH